MMKIERSVDLSTQRARIFADVFNPDCRAVEVCGPARSGKTTQLVDIANACAEAAPTVWLMPEWGQAPPGVSDKVSLVNGTMRRFRMMTKCFVVIDDVDCFDNTPEGRVEDIAKRRVGMWSAGTVITSRGSSAESIHALTPLS